MTTHCSSCGKELTEIPGEKFILCKYCNRFIPTGANSFIKMKGGNKNMGKITDIRIANANKVLELIKSLEVEDKEVTKILSRASRIFKESKKSEE